MVLAALLAVAAIPATLTIVPTPKSMTVLSGVHRFGPKVSVSAGTGLASQVLALKRVFSTGGVTVQESKSGAEVELKLDPNSNLGEEGYRLDVDAKAVRIVAKSPAGVFYGIQTLRQLLPTEIENPAKAKTVAWEVPCIQIEDKPRFPWRGAMLDDSRHFFPKKDIEGLIDLLSLHKFNTFHWHLNDDGGWRMESKKYPKLTSWGAWRLPSNGSFPEYINLSFPGPEGKNLYGGFHPQDEIKEIVAYAAARHVTVVPEIEMPGHNLAATRAYPELVCSPDLAEGFRKAEGFEFPNIFCAGKESTFKIVENILDEAMELFPSKVIHIGGDEVDKWLWNRCPDCQKRMKDEGLKNAAELESYFIQRIEKYLNSKGRKLIGWDEILEGGLAPNATVMSWRGIEGGIAAAKARHDVVMTPWDDCYFDHNNAILPLDQVRRFEPIPAELDAEEAKHVLGAQANVWTEHLFTMAEVQDRFFPRLAALADVLWSPKKQVEDASAGLDSYFQRLDELGVKFHAPAPRTPLTVVPSGDPLVLKVPKLDGATLRYTTDGTEPSLGSPIYRGPLPTDSPVKYRAAYFLRDGRQSYPITVMTGEVRPEATKDRKPGICWSLYDGAYAKVPDFLQLTPVASGVASEVKVQADRKTNFALLEQGYLRIEKPGVYELSLSSDDGSVLWLGQAKIIDNDGYHGLLTLSAKLYLKAGDYPIRVGFFQGTEDASLKIAIQGPGLPKQPIPGALLWH